MSRPATTSSTKPYSIALVTAPDLKTARQLAKAALERRLIACANLISKLESHYWWKGKIEIGNEVLMVLKTKSANLADLQKLILADHPYDTAEFIVLPISRGSQRYLNWISNSVR